jgi:hypothetical protein
MKAVCERTLWRRINKRASKVQDIGTRLNHGKERRGRAMNIRKVMVVGAPTIDLTLAGNCGRKTGKGWYDYTSGEKKPRTDINF